MTPQQLKAMKMALEAMESVTVECNNFHHSKKDQNHDWAKCPPVARWDKAITAIKEVLAEYAMRETQRLGQEIEQEPVAQPERHELQAKGEHPAPCARHCEANAFQIVIKNLKAELKQALAQTELCKYGQEPKSCTSNPMDCQCAIDAALAQPEQKMVMWPCLIDTADFSKGTVTIVMQCEDYKVSAGPHWLSIIPTKETT